MGPGTRALVVDDDREAALALSILLRSGLQWQVRTAHDGFEALELADAYRPDIAFLDIMMPGMNGLELARRMREAAHLKHIPIIAVSSLDGGDLERDALGAGFNLRLVKPVLIETLGRALQRLWSGAPPRA